MRLIKDAKDYINLAEYLSKCEQVNQYDSDEEREAWTLAHTFQDLEASFRKILDEHLPLLVEQKLNSEEIHDKLHDIGEELRHILYHINSTKYYDYLIERNGDGT